MKELYKQLASIKTYKIEEITADKEQKILKIKYTSIIGDIPVIGYIDNTGTYFEVDLIHILSSHPDVLKIMGLIPLIEETFRENYSNCSLNVSKLTVGVKIGESIDNAIKFIDNCLIYSVGITTPRQTRPTGFGMTITGYPGIFIKNHSYFYSNYFRSNLGFGFLRQHEKYIRYSIIDGLIKSNNKEYEIGICDKKSLDRFFELNTNMLIALKNIKELKVSSYHTLKLVDDTYVKLLIKNSKDEIDLGSFKDNEFRFKGMYGQNFAFSILVTLY